MPDIVLFAKKSISFFYCFSRYFHDFQRYSTLASQAVMISIDLFSQCTEEQMLSDDIDDTSSHRI